MLLELLELPARLATFGPALLDESLELVALVVEALVDRVLDLAAPA